jgi:hypothetical protein
VDKYHSQSSRESSIRDPEQVYRLLTQAARRPTFPFFNLTLMVSLVVVARKKFTAVTVFGRRCFVLVVP